VIVQRTDTSLTQKQQKSLHISEQAVSTVHVQATNTCLMQHAAERAKITVYSSNAHRKQLAMTETS